MQAVVEYLTKVLGVETFLQSPNDRPSGTQVLKVLFFTTVPFSPTASVLFKKITEAMKLTPSDFQLCTGNWDSQLQADFIVSFSGEPKLSEVQKAIPLLVTENPEKLIKDPGLKRKVWQDLQKVMKYISIEESPSAT